jgi:hypothetical protein
MGIKHRANSASRKYLALRKLCLGRQVRCSEMPYVSYPRPLCAIRGIKNRTGPRYSLPTTQSPSLPVKDSFGPFGHRECRKKDPAHKINAPVMPALCARSTPLKSNSPGIRTRAAMTANCTQRRL